MSNVMEIMSLNVNGLGSPVKRKRVMMKLKKEKKQVFFLQETHMIREEHEKLKRFGYRNSYFSSFKGGRRRGVIILISNSVMFDMEKEIKDKEGRYIMVVGKLENEPVTLINVYAPPESDKTFFKELFNIIAVEAKGLLIMGGDTNMVLCDKKDTTSKNRSKKYIAKFINTTLQEMGLIDIWRMKHPLERGYTHYSAAHQTHSRIDQFFVRQEDAYRVSQCRIGAADLSDHNPIFLTISINNRKRQTLWRLNVGMLNNEQRKEGIRKEIKTYLEINNNGEVDPTIVWDAMKAVIRGKLIAETSLVKKAKKEMYKKNEEELRKLEREFQDTEKTETYNQIKELRAKIQNAQLDEVEKNNRFVKQNYYEAGTKATKLLARRIRKQQEMSSICRIKDPLTDDVKSAPEDIERIFKQYYENLYSQPDMPGEEEMDKYLDELDLPSIGEVQNAKITSAITVDEVTDAISSFKNGKSSGSDGFSIEFYKTFREELAPILVTSFNWTLKEHKIPPSWSEAVISLIYKQGRDKDRCGSYRPISVLNVDYKIYAKIIAWRLARITEELIGTEQTGFTVGRQTHDNIRRTIRIVDQAQRTKTSTLIVSVDAEAAYDRVSWRFLYAVLGRFGFNKEAIHCVKSLYQQPTARIKVNGSLSEKFTLQRSTRQGCSLSPTLFTYFIEPLAQAVRQNNNIHGVNVSGAEHKIGLFADDVITFLERPNESLPELSKTIEEFGRLSGYKINIAKTQVLTLNYRPSRDIQDTFEFNWKQKSIKYLGINITKRISTLFEANYKRVNQELQRDVDRWSTLPLDLSSRLEAVKMNVLARLLYLFQALPVEVPQAQFDAWDRLISRFIWGGKRPRIKFRTLQLPKENGGWGLPNLKNYYYASQLRYIGCWCDGWYEARWKDMEIKLDNQPIQNMLGDKQAFKSKRQQLDPITQFTLDTWFKIIKKHKLENDIKILKWIAFDSNFKPALYNKAFRIWNDKGMTAWCRMVKDGQLRCFEDMKEEFWLDKHEFFMYLQLRDYYKKEIEFKEPKKLNGVIQIMVQKYNGKQIRLISAIYQELMGNENYSTHYIKEKWEKELDIEITKEDWIKMWGIHHSATNSRIWREFSWKNLSRFFITPKIKSKQVHKQMKCWRECGETDVDHSHIFWKCLKIQRFWEMLHSQLQKILGYEIPRECRVLYLGDLDFEEGKIHEEDRYLIKILLTAGKKAITRSWGRVEPPNCEQWIELVDGIFIMEQMTYRLRLQEEQIERRWWKWTNYKSSNRDI